MTRSRPITFLLGAAALPLAALTVAACGGGGAATASPAPPASAPQPATTKSPAPTVRVATSSLGKILVNSQGQTLYLFKADVGTKSACTGACAAAWPPLLATGKPTAGSGANRSLLGTTTRSDGRRQVTYNGHPLYLFIQDTQPGQTTGEGVTAFGGAWFVLSPTGKQISSHASGHSGSSSPQAAVPPAATTTTPKPATPPAAKPKPATSNGIPQNGGGDDDSDNHGGPSDGDGNI